MQQAHRLCTDRQFGYVYRRGKRSSYPELSLIYAKSKQKKIGFSINKKVGGAVVRNRTKRRLRAIVRPLLPLMKNGMYVILVRPSIVNLNYQTLSQQVEALFKRVNAIEDKIQ